MLCPWCQSSGPFESLYDVTFRPVIEGWEFDRAPTVLHNQKLFACLSCDNIVKIDQRSKIISEHSIDPVFDEFVEEVIATLKQNPNDFVDETIVKQLRDRKFRGINRLMTGRLLLSKIIEKRP